MLHSWYLPPETLAPFYASCPLHNTTRPAIASALRYFAPGIEQSVDGRANRLPPEMNIIMTQQDELCRLRQHVQQMQQQLDKVQKLAQPAPQEAQDPSRQQMQHQVNQILEEVHELYQHKEQMDEVLQKIQRMDQEVQESQERFQKHMEETLQMTQRLDITLKEIREMNQKVSDSHSELQLQLGELLRRTEPLDQQTRSSREQTQLLQQPLERQTDEDQTLQHGNQQEQHPLHQLNQQSQERPPGSSEGQKVEDHSPSMLQTPELDPSSQPKSQDQIGPAPRFFIILEKESTSDDFGASCSPQFRLHFLCESSPQIKDEEGGELHLTNHPGYDISNPSGFFDKFGPHLLRMMYMVKSRFKAKRLVVSPFPPSTITTETVADQDHLGHIRDNIYKLIRGTIRHLEKSTGHIDINMEEHQILDSLELDQVNQYLKVEVGERVSGCLIQTMVQDGHCKWMCDFHRRQHHTATMVRLQEAILCEIPWQFGQCLPMAGNIKIHIRSEPLMKQLYESAIKLCNTQIMGNRVSPKVLSLKLDDSAGSTKDIILNLINLTSLELVFPRLSITINISDGNVQDVAIKIDHLYTLTQDDLGFIKQCNPVQLSIANTPEEDDEERLVDILRLIPKLTELHVGCHSDRSAAIIDFIIATRGKILQDEGSSALHTFKLMDEELAPFDKDASRNRTCIATTVSFSTDSVTFDMETEIALRGEMLFSESPVHDFFRQYGWSIKTLCAPIGLHDSLAKMLDDSTEERGSRISYLYLYPSSLTTSGLDALDRAIKRSQSFGNFVLILDYKVLLPRIGFAKILLGRYGDKLCDLRIGHSFQYTTELARAFPTRANFPALRHFSLDISSGMSETSQLCSQWITSLISAPLQATNAALSSTTSCLAKSLTSLTSIELARLRYSPSAWKLLIGAIDFSSLERLRFCNSNFSQNQLKVLVDRIDELSASHPVQLKEVYFELSNLSNRARVCTMCAKFNEKYPNIYISYR